MEVLLLWRFKDHKLQDQIGQSNFDTSLARNDQNLIAHDDNEN